MHLTPEKTIDYQNYPIVLSEARYQGFPIVHYQK